MLAFPPLTELHSLAFDDPFPPMIFINFQQNPSKMHSLQIAPSRSPPSPGSPSMNVQSFSNTFIQRSRPYLSGEQIEALLPRDSQLEAKDISTRLNACNWIMQVGQNMQL